MRQVALLWVILLSGCGNAPQPDFPNLASVVRIDQDNSMGTGFVVAVRKTAGGYVHLILTAKHVVAEPGAVMILGAQAQVVNLHSTLDLAAIRLLLPAPLPVAQISLARLKPYEEVTILGYPNASTVVWITRGLASDLDRATAPIWFGNSGGPVCGPDGGVRGVVSMIGVSRYPQAAIPHLATFVPLDREWLTSLWP